MKRRKLRVVLSIGASDVPMFVVGVGASETVGVTEVVDVVAALVLVVVASVEVGGVEVVVGADDVIPTGISGAIMYGTFFGFGT